MYIYATKKPAIPTLTAVESEIMKLLTIGEGMERCTRELGEEYLVAGLEIGPHNSVESEF